MDKVGRAQETKTNLLFGKDRWVQTKLEKLTHYYAELLLRLYRNFLQGTLESQHLGVHRKRCTLEMDPNKS